MGQSEEGGRNIFPAVRLDSGLKRMPDAADLRRLSTVLDGPPRWVPFTAPQETSGPPRPRRIALIVAVADNPRLVADAQSAAGLGESTRYAFPGAGTPEARRCAGALVITTRSGNIPDDREHYEALIRHIVTHWRRTVEEQGADETCWLFTDAPVTMVVALGALLGRRTTLVPLRHPNFVGAPPEGPRAPATGGVPTGPGELPGPAAQPDPPVPPVPPVGPSDASRPPRSGEGAS
jgi:hypothetical protein